VIATLRQLEPVRGLLAVMAIVGLWYVAALSIGGQDFFVKHILKENVFRVLDPGRLDTGHLHGPLYLVPQFLLGALPWSLLAPALVWWLWRMRPLDATTRYLVVWFVTVFVFFSASASKRSVYLLPAYPAAALLLGRILGPGPEDPGPRRLATWGLLVASAGLFLVGLVSLAVASSIPIERLVIPFLKPKDQQGVVAALGALRDGALQTAAATLVVLAAAAATAVTARGAHWLRASMTLSTALLALYGGIVLPIDRSLAATRTLKPFMTSVIATVQQDDLGFFCAFDYGAVYYSDRRIRVGPAERVCRDETARVHALRTPGGPKYLLLWEDEATRAAPYLEVLLRSEGTGPKGRARMVLASRVPSS
jgi:hypothetical protein